MKNSPRSKVIPRRAPMPELVVYPDDVERPKTRADCANVPRPCPWVSCRHNLYLDLNTRSLGVKLNFPALEPHEMEHSCALDVAEGGDVTLEQVAIRMNITRERVRQIITYVGARLARSMGGWRGYSAPVTKSQASELADAASAE